MRDLHLATDHPHRLRRCSRCCCMWCAAGYRSGSPARSCQVLYSRRRPWHRRPPAMQQTRPAAAGSAPVPLASSASSMASCVRARDRRSEMLIASAAAASESPRPHTIAASHELSCSLGGDTRAASARSAWVAFAPSAIAASNAAILAYFMPSAARTLAVAASEAAVALRNGLFLTGTSATQWPLQVNISS